jgi:uncharacterized protein (DUF58 family)
VLTAAEARRLEHLRISTSRASPAPGVRRARPPGAGLEFHDFRAYQPGDDPRSIDWTIEARLRQLLVRVCRAEGRTSVHLLVDISRSMTVGRPSKLACAVKMAAAFAYVAAERRDGVACATFDDRVRARVRPAAGRAQLHRVLGALTHLPGGGRSAIDPALTSYAEAVRGPGLAIVLSDFLDADAREDGLRYLRYRGLAPVPIQVLADEDLAPPVTGETELVDSEDPSAAPLLVDAAAVRAYRDRLDARVARLRQFCATHHLPYLQVPSSTPFDDLVTVSVRAGLLALDE